MPVEILNPTEQKFETAITLRIPPFNWIPPETPPLNKTESQRDKFNLSWPDFQAACNARFANGVEPGGNHEHIGKKEDHIPNVPHPFSKYDHRDPIPRNQAELMKLSLSEVESFRRMDAAFKWLVCRAASLLVDINNAVENYYPNDPGSVGNYTSARQNYIDFLVNLNNHDPKGAEIDPGRGLGFGRNLRWAYIDPVVSLVPQKDKSLVTALTVVAEWNPHISSSGVPIRH